MSADDRDDVIPFLYKGALEVGSVELQSGGLGDTILIKIDELRGQWDRLVRKIVAVVTEGTTPLQGARLDEVTIQLGFNAKGKLVFLAEAGAQVAFTAKLKFHELSGESNKKASPLARSEPAQKS